MRLKALLPLVIAVLGLAAPAYAACVPDLVDYSLKGEFKRAKYIVVAKALKETWLDEAGKPTKLGGDLTFGTMPGGFDPYLGAEYELNVVEAYKGAPPSKLTLFSGNHSGRTPLDVGDTYLLFVFEGEDELGIKRLVTDRCGNSKYLPAGNATLAKVKAMAKRR